MIELLTPQGTQRPVRVAAAMHPRDLTAIDGEVELLPLSGTDWHGPITAFEPDVLVVQSVEIRPDRHPVAPLGGAVHAVAKWCRDRGTPSVFWSTIAADRALDDAWTAAAFDHVATADLDTMLVWRSALGHDRVHLVPLGVQPRTHHPLNRPPPAPTATLATDLDPSQPPPSGLLDLLQATIAELPVVMHDLTGGGGRALPPALRHLLGSASLDVAASDRASSVGLHLPTVTQSPTLVDRRLLELLAAAAPSVGPHAHAAQLLFGDAVTTTGDRHHLAAAVRDAVNTPDEHRALVALRRLLQAHTWEHRLRSLLAPVLDVDATASLPTVHAVAAAATPAELARLDASLRRQLHPPAAVTVVVPPHLHARGRDLPGRNLRVVAPTDRTAVTGGDVVAVLDARDHHGPAHLLDLVLATRFTPGRPIGRAAHHVWDGTGARLVDGDRRHRASVAAPLRAAVLPTSLVADRTVQQLTADPDAATPGPVTGIDPWHYCRDVPDGAEQAAAAAVDVPVGDADVVAEPAVGAAAARAATMPVPGPPDAPLADLAALLGTMADGGLEVLADHGDVEVVAHEDATGDVWAPVTVAPDPLVTPGWATMWVDVHPRGMVDLRLQFLDEDGEQLATTTVHGNVRASVPVPRGTTAVRPGLRVHAPGRARLGGLRLGGDPAQGPILAAGRQLLVTNRYPTYAAPYNNMFVHKRVQGYHHRGVPTDVLRLVEHARRSVHEFEQVECTTGGRQVLDELLGGSDHDSVAVHFLTPAVWDTLRQHASTRRVAIWVHGFEIQPWWRRAFAYESEDELDHAKQATEARMTMWREVLADPRPHFVFVSDFLAQQAMEDTGIELPPERYSVIHNPVDTDLFAHHAKDPDQRFRLLSIRPFASNIYANDLTVAGLLELVDEPWFERLQVRMIGEGRLFSDVTAPLRDLPNVSLEPRVLQQREIAELHREHGVFLCPSRLDSHGVSRDEAMASGLVPITSDVAAIPEFVDDTCAFLAPRDDHHAIADAIRTLVADPDLFLRMSDAAAARVRRQADHGLVLDAELAVLAG